MDFSAKTVSCAPNRLAMACGMRMLLTFEIGVDDLFLVARGPSGPRQEGVEYALPSSSFRDYLSTQQIHSHIKKPILANSFSAFCS